MYHETTNMRVLLHMVLASTCDREPVVLDDRITHALYSDGEASFAIDVIVTSQTPPHTETDLTFEFSRGVCVLCDREIAQHLMNADRNKRLMAINVTNNKFDFQQRQGFIPNGAKPIPTLQEALTALDAIPAKAGNFGDALRSGFMRFTPNEKPDTHPDMQAPAKRRTSRLTALGKDLADATPDLAPPPEGLTTFNKLNKGCYWDNKRAGFWRPSAALLPGERLPFPVITTCFGYSKTAFIARLEEVQADLQPRVFRGMAKNRWTGEFNGCAEYRVDGWHWPEGYLTYLKAGVLPSGEFYQFVIGRHLKGLPTYQPK